MTEPDFKLLGFTPQHLEFFQAKIPRGAPSECWEWQGTTRKTGYGYFYIRRGKRLWQHRAHRIAYMLASNDDPCRRLICHTCDNRKCCNPAHLFKGTTEDNMADMVRKGRSASGSRHGSHVHPERVARGERHGSRTHPEAVLRGDRNPARLHPERMPRGNRHGSQTRPERVPKGERQGLAKLNNQSVLEIRAKYQPWRYSASQLAREYGVSKRTILQVIHRRIWTHV